MAKLDSLIRYQKWELDNKRRELAAVEEEREQIIQKLQRLSEEFQAEAENVAHEAATLMMGAYAAGVSYRRGQLEEELTRKDEELDLVREKVTEAFQELKTYEIACENRLKQERKEEARRENLQLDEQGLQGYVRKDAG